uniref:Transmembrane and immunoglobulin domain containing 1 n=1 Tax=Cynoglossus semilaevis TaxID=244447 RepID=A0A3P8VJ34_CYNSE
MIQSDPASSGGVIQTELKTTVSLLCQPEGSAETETDEELVWLRNGVMVSLKDDNKIGRSSVCVTPVIYEDNEATFTCHLSNNATRRASITLNFPPLISFHIPLETVSLLCQAQSNPASQYVWFYNNSQVYMGPQYTITKVLRMHTGDYACLAQNTYLNTRSRKTISLTVYCDDSGSGVSIHKIYKKTTTKKFLQLYSEAVLSFNHTPFGFSAPAMAIPRAASPLTTSPMSATPTPSQAPSPGDDDPVSVTITVKTTGS